MKIVINTCYGSFGISKDAFKLLNLKWLGYGFINNETFNIKSNNPYEYRTYTPLVNVVEQLGDIANGKYAKLKIIDIPYNIDWHIHNYDGIETVHEEHRLWS